MVEKCTDKLVMTNQPDIVAVDTKRKMVVDLPNIGKKEHEKLEKNMHIFKYA